MKQTIAVIGATGNLGSAISKALANGPYRLLLKGNEQPELERLVKEIKRLHQGAEVEIAICSTDACWEADIILLTVPFDAIEISRKIREVANQKIVVSIEYPLNKTNEITEYAASNHAAEELQSLLPHSKVTRAYSAAFATDFTILEKTVKKEEVFVSGNDEEAVKTVSRILATTGFDPKTPNK